MLCSLAILNGCQTVQNEEKPTDEPRETIVKEAPFHQGESIHVAPPPAESAKCLVTGCNNASCFNESLEREGCSFRPKDICYEKANCKLLKYRNDLRCGWEETPEFKQCEKEVEQEIDQMNELFRETRDKCGSSERCTFEYAYRDDRFEFTLGQGDWPLFRGGSMTILHADDINDLTYNTYPYMRIAIDTDEHFINPSKMWDVEEIHVNGASGIKYKTKNFFVKEGCEAYRLEYKDKFYYFEGYEGCISFGDEFSDSLRFYED